MFADTLGVKKIPVLLVEDAADDAMVTRRQLYAIDDEFDISRATCLKEALSRVAAGKVDAVVLDLGLPDADGPQAIQTLHGTFPDLPIIVLSGRDDPMTIRCALEYGAQGFVSKSASSGQTIRQAILSAIVRKSLTH